MVHLYVNGKVLDMKEKYKISFSLLNPAFSNDAFPRIFSTNFKIPRTAKNNEILDFQSTFDIEDVKNKYQCFCYLDGLPWKFGFLRVQDYDDLNIELYFVSDAIKASDDYAKQNIRDLITEEFTVPGLQTHEYSIRLQNFPAQSIVPNKPYSIKIGDKEYNFVYPTSTPNLTILNEMIATINLDFPNVASGSFLAPYRTLNLDLTGLNFPKVEFGPEVSAWFQIGTPTTHGAIQIRDLWNTYLNANPEIGNNNVRFPVIKNPNFYDNQNERWFKYVNYHSVNHKTNTSSEEGTGFQYNLSPQIRNGYILESIASQFNFTPTGLYNDPDFQKLFIYNNNAIDRMEWENPDRFANIPDINYVLNSYQYTFKLSDHIPDITSSEYLTNLAESLNLFYIYEHGFLNIVNRSNVITTEPIDWSNKIDYKGYSSSTPDNEDYHILFELDDSNDDYTNDNLVSENGNNISENKTAVPAPLYHTNDIGDVPISGGNDRQWKILITNSKGNSEFKNLSGNDAGFRLFLYHGMTNDLPGSSIAANRPYPFASSDSVDVDANDIGNLILDLSDEADSSFKKYWKKWLEFQSKTSPISFITKVGISDIMNIDWEQPNRMVCHSNGNLRFIISKLNFTINECGISSSKVDGFKIK